MALVAILSLSSLVQSSLPDHHHRIDFSDLPPIDLFGDLMDDVPLIADDEEPTVMRDTRRSYREGEEGLDSDVLDVISSLCPHRLFSIGQY